MHANGDKTLAKRLCKIKTSIMKPYKVRNVSDTKNLAV